MPRSASRTRTSRSRQPPPRSTIRGIEASPTARRRSFAASKRAAACSAQGTSSSWICAVITGASASPVNPPLSRTIRAALEAAATIEGSSTAIGMRTSRPFTLKFKAIESGKAWVAITFSLIRSTTATGSPPPAVRCAHERSSSKPSPFTRASLSPGHCR